jgi:hypothetical protein
MTDMDANFNCPESVAGMTSVAASASSSAQTGRTLYGIFAEPVRTFDALRVRPRFFAAAIIVAALTLTLNGLLIRKIGYENIVRHQIEGRASGLDAQQRERLIQRQLSVVVESLAFTSPLFNLAITLAIGAVLYWLGALAFGRVITYRQALCVWTYSTLPPTALAMLISIALVLLQPLDKLGAVHPSSGLVLANLGFLVNSRQHPELATVLGMLDIFSFYGLLLAALGLRRVARLSVGAAVAIVLTLWVLSLIFRVALAAVLGQAMI